MTFNSQSDKKELPLIPSNLLLVLPSWGDIIGYYTMGQYVSQEVKRILTDPVIFISCAETTIKNEKGIFHCLFGVGYYNVKFGLTRPGIITDSRPLTGLILSDFVYDHLATSKIVSAQKNSAITIAEKVIRIPFNVKFDSEEQKTFLKGVIMRFLFIPHKDVVLDFFSNIRNNDLFSFQQSGHLLLTATKENFDEILVSDKMGTKSPTYLNSIPGINKISKTADSFMAEMFSETFQHDLNEKLLKIRGLLAGFNVDEMYLYSLIEQGAITLNICLPDTSDNIIPSEVGKAWLFQSAAERINEIAPWSPEIKRNQAKESEKEAALKAKAPLVAEVMKPASEQIDLGNYQPTSEQIHEETYGLRVSTTETVVNQKPLPPLPVGNVEALLKYAYDIVQDKYDMPTLAQGFEACWQELRKLTLQADYIWELSRFVKDYSKQPIGQGLAPKDRAKLTNVTKMWYERELNARLEAERKERERLEAEQRERERIEQERIESEQRERDRIERERLEEERKKREFLEKKRLETEQREIEKLAREKEERERQERERHEAERIEQERLEREGSFEYRINFYQEKLKEIKQEDLEWKQHGKDIQNRKKETEKQLKKVQKEQKKALKKA